MEIMIQNTNNLYEELLKLPANDREAFYEREFLKPYQKMKEMYMPHDPKWMGALPLTGCDKEIKESLKKLQDIGVWKTAKEAIQEANKRFLHTGILVPDKVLVGIFIGDATMLINTQGIMGFGSLPGYIQIVIAPDEKSISLLPSTIAHEFHHNVLFKNISWNFMSDITVAKYLALEGLAESFAESIYGFESVGPWVKEVIDEDIDKTRKIIGNALNVKGFNEVRKYIFGDQLLDYELTESTGIPRYGGYAVGYYAVQEFLKNTDMSVEESTILDGEEIMEKSGYFI